MRLAKPFHLWVLLFSVATSALTATSVAANATESVQPKPDSVTTVGTMRVERYGHGSPAMIFLPGLSCGSWVWDDAVKAYGATHAVYLVTLAGFDGLPAPTGPALDSADASLLSLIKGEKLDRPIVVGHSLGGHLAIRFGEEHADLVRAIVSVDGTPVFPTLVQATQQQRIAAADATSEAIAATSHDEYVAGAKQTIATMVTSPDDVTRIAALTTTSDQKAVASYLSDLLRADLRPQLASLTVPLLEIAPVPTTPQAFEGTQPASMTDRQARYEAFYTSLFPAAPHLSVVTIPNSKHFIMVDQPTALFAAISEFVAKISP